MATSAKSKVRAITIAALLACLVAGGIGGYFAWKRALSQRGQWRAYVSIIEAPSCPQFGPLSILRRSPSTVSGEPQVTCFINSAYMVRSGKVHDLDVTGLRFWLVGATNAEGKIRDGILTVETRATPAQREALLTLLAKLGNVVIDSLSIREGRIEWRDDGSVLRLSPRSQDIAEATLDDGRAGQLLLKRPDSALDPSQPIVVDNLAYWGAARTMGFNLMPAALNSWHSANWSFELQNTHGYTVTVQVDSTGRPPSGSSRSQ